MSHELDSYADELFPAIVIGYKLYGSALQHFLTMPDLPEWFSIIADHQVGGYACCHRSVAGVVLRLADNRAYLRRPDQLLRSFAALGGDTSVSLERDLSRMAYTAGDPYTAEELSHLSEFLNAGGSFPQLQRGIEALVEFEEGDPLRCFNGWRMHSVAQERKPASGNSSSDPEAWQPERCFSEDHLAQLEIIGELLNSELHEENRWEIGGFDAAVTGCFLLWMNTD